MRVSTVKYHSWVYKQCYITEQKFAEEYVKKLLSCKGTLGLDIETAKKKEYELNSKAGLAPNLSYVRLIQIYSEELKIVCVFDMFKLRKELLAFLLSSKKFVAHNAVFELKHLNFCGLSVDDIHCSMLMSILVDRAERSPFEKEEIEDEEVLSNEKPVTGVFRYRKRGGYSLNNLCNRYFGVEPSKELQASDWGVEKLSGEQINYAALDAVLTFKLGELLFPKIVFYRMKKAYGLIKKMQHVISHMENNGIYLDDAEHTKLIRKWEIAEVVALKNTKPYFGKTNLNSSKQMNTWVRERFKDRPAVLNSWPNTAASKPGKILYSFNRTALAHLNKLKEIEALLAYKKVNKLLSTYGKPLKEKINPFSHRIHCNFVLGETRTGRLSSRDPNLQNIPRDVEMKHIFSAAEGKILVAADFSQIEMRVAAEVSKDTVMLKAFEKGIDLHKYIVAVLTGKNYSAVTDDERQLGKAINFGLLFGMGPTKLKLYALIGYNVTLSDEQAEKAWATFHRLYRIYSAWCQTQRAKCEKIGYVRTPLGKMRKLEPDEVYTKAVNTPVQGGAAEVNFAALVECLKHVRLSSHFSIINNVHDEIILEVTDNPSYIAHAKAFLQSSMENGMRYVFPNACLKGLIEVKTGKTWADTKKKVKVIPFQVR